MAEYTKNEAREWAKDKLWGAVNCLIPSFTNDLTDINEAAIRHDIRLSKQHGFVGTLQVSEVQITEDEYGRLLDIAVDEAAGELVVTHHASWSTLEQNIRTTRRAESAGAELVLLTFPPSFYPETEQDVYDYVKGFCDATNLAVILFPMFLWGFSSRIHPSDIPTRLIRRLIDDCPNLAVIKAEGGFPSIMSIIECQRLFGDEVVISCPIEGELLTLGQLFPIQLSATSDHEAWGSTIPDAMRLLWDGKHDEVTELYWRMHPMRKVRGGIAQQLNGGNSINRQWWKFAGWLQGYNGGPLRAPAQRIHDPQMTQLRHALAAFQGSAEQAPLREFFVGRNPA